MSHINFLAKQARKTAMARAGSGWPLFSKHLQEALIAWEALVIVAQNKENPGWERAALLAENVLFSQKE